MSTHLSKLSNIILITCLVLSLLVYKQMSITELALANLSLILLAGGLDFDETPKK